MKLYKKIHPAWFVLIACIFFQGATLGIMNNCLGLFYASIANDLGFRMGDLSIYTTIMQLISALLISRMVILLTRKNMHLYLLLATVICCISFGAMGLFNSLYQFYISSVVMGIFGCIVFVTPVSILINNWFFNSKSLAFGIAFASSGVFGAILNPICSSIIELVGWRTAIILMSVISLLMSVPFILLFMRRTPEEKGFLPYGMEKERNSSSNFRQKGTGNTHIFYRYPLLLLGCCMMTKAIFCWFSQYNGHLVKFGQSIGLSLVAASSLTSFAMIGNVFSKIVIGIIGDKKGYQPAMYLGLGCSCLGFILFSLNISNHYILYSGGFFFGFSNALASQMHSMIAANLYTNNNYEKNYAKITSAGYLGSSIAVAAIGYSYDIFNSYQPSMIWGIVLCFVSVCFGIAISRLSRKRK